MQSATREERVPCARRHRTRRRSGRSSKLPHPVHGEGGWGTCGQQNPALQKVARKSPHPVSVLVLEVQLSCPCRSRPEVRGAEPGEPDAVSVRGAGLAVGVQGGQRQSPSESGEKAEKNHAAWDQQKNHAAWDQRDWDQWKDRWEGHHSAQSPKRVTQRVAR